VIGVLTKDEPQMPFTGDQHPVQALAAGAADPALGDRVRARRPARDQAQPPRRSPHPCGAGSYSAA
jgi:hypothetical protein